MENQMQKPESHEQVKVEVWAKSLNISLKSTDMHFSMQEHAFKCTKSLLDAFMPSSVSERPSFTHLARAMKKEFDLEYGPAWHCAVGTSFGSFVTHSSPEGFIYFSIDSLSFLLFKTEVHLMT